MKKINFLVVLFLIPMFAFGVGWKRIKENLQILGNQIHVKNATPSIIIEDTGSLGTDATPRITMKDASGTLGDIGFLTGASYTMTFRNYSSVGSLSWVINATEWLGINQNGIISVSGRFDVGAGINIAPNTVSLTADDQAVTTTGKAFIQLSSDNSTATNRTFTLGVPVAGQILVLQWTHATNRGELVDDSSDGLGNVRLNGTWSPDQNDTLSLIGTGSGDWIETARSAN